MYFLSFNLVDLLVYTCIAIFSYILYLQFKNKERKKQYEKVMDWFPGPPVRFLGGNELNFLFRNKDITFMLLDYVKEYGSRYTLQLGGELYIVLAEPKDVEEILGSMKCIDRGPTFTKTFGRIFGNSTFSCNVHVWKKNRRTLQFPFKTNFLNNYTETINDETGFLIQKLQKVAESGKTINAIKYITTVAFNVYCRDFLDCIANVPENEHTALKEANGKHLSYCFHRLFQPKLVTFVRDLLLKKEYNRLYEDLEIVYNKVYNEGKLEKSSSTLETKNVKEFRKFIYCLRDGPFTDQDIKDDVINYSGASTETVTATISFMLLMLGIHQDIQEKVYEELRDIFGDTGDRDVTVEDFNKMTYLDQVLMETERMFPLIPLMFRHLSGNVTIGQYTVPPGVNVIIHMYALHHDPRYYPQPGKFDPERFSPERKAEIPKGSFIPFSYGPRNCIGKAFAIHQLKIISSRILYNFHVKTDMKLDDIKLVSHVVLSTNDGNFPISVSARKHNSSL